MSITRVGQKKKTKKTPHKPPSLAANVNLKSWSQRAFSQGKELLNVFTFPNHLRARECETALKNILSKRKGQRDKNVFDSLMFLTCSLPSSLPYNIAFGKQLKLTLAETFLHGSGPCE